MVKPGRQAPPTVLRRLGGGGMADVYLARFDSGEQVALKRLRPELATDSNLLEQLEGEARLCGLLTHEHIVGFKGIGADDEGPYLALEYVEGLSASALLRKWTAAHRTHLPMEAVLSLIADLADGLAYAHAFRGEGVNGVIHRDVSPDNVLVSSSGVAKLADFGIAKVLGATTVTRTGTIKGKLGYLAPELFDSASASPASDVFSLGATAFRLLAGVNPFQGANEAQIMRAVLHNEPPNVASLRAEVPEDVAAWVDRSLRKDPEARPLLTKLSSQLAEVRKQGRVQLAGCVQTLLPTAESTREIVVSARQTKVARPARARKAWAIWTAAILVTALVAAAGWKLSTVAPPPVPTVELAAPPPPTPESMVNAAPKPKPPAQRPRPPRQTAKEILPVKESAPLTGTLRIKVRPWGNVFVDGTPRGTAPPLAPLELSAGKHSVIVVNPQSKQSRTHEVEVIAGQEIELKVVLDNP